MLLLVVISDAVGEHDEERPARRLSGRWALFVWAVSVAVALLVLKQVFLPFAQGNQYYLVIFLGVTLPLVFLCYRPRGTSAGEDGDNPGPLDWVFAGIALLVGLYPVLPLAIGDAGGGFDTFLDRQGQLSTADIVAGTLLLVLVLEATRRTTGLVLPVVCLVFLAFSYYGGYLPQDWDISHAGVDFSQIINALYNDQSGFYGIPLDVAATYIVLFTIYGAVLASSGAGTFFVDLSFALFRRSRTAPGRTAALSGFLLGTVSGSGTATTVSLGAITWPVLRKAGYPKENAGGLLAASGIGAILSPPTLGAAAFIIAEYLEVDYLTVLVWAIVPTLLYYLGIAFAVEIDARRFGAQRVEVDSPPVGTVLLRGGYHFLSLAIIVVFLALDIPPFTAVVYATGVAALFALAARLLTHRADGVAAGLLTWLRALADSLAEGIRGALPVIAVCAAAGVITSTITKTGLGLELAAALVDAAQALASNPTVVLTLTVVFAAVAVSVLGLAVPVTASFIIAWVVLAPALADLGVAPPEVAMFIFYYAVLSEVTPPTALASVAAAAITGGSVMKTMWQTWKYTLPAFLVPIAFVLTDNGSALLLQRDVGTVAWVVAVSALGVAALAVVTGGWLFGPARWPERALCAVAAALLLYLQPLSVAVGIGCAVVAVVVHLAIRPKQPVTGQGSEA
ncbi:C4-dicarboxylate ABC transporter permease [Actinophytocola xinjiangensis]|uniref:C4-dicarboxylate ABC transporter permease n=1 Tax=Actinophytocola xinjiangensis TaxID=485602 RepID=A0A7Z1AYB6_9PSEU|nr:TRAP transporter fused permease subunit [Actinophytocola xinjiangensis]OLF09467.1 C4-dicarboxylate ABC transporter permease [Actinophytocola xinjiangensis]